MKNKKKIQDREREREREQDRKSKRKKGNLKKSIKIENLQKNIVYSFLINKEVTKKNQLNV